MEFKQPTLPTGGPRESTLAIVTAKLRTPDQAMWSEKSSTQLKLSCQYHPDNFKDFHDLLVHSLKKNKYLSPALCDMLGIQVSRTEMALPLLTYSLEEEMAVS